MVCVAFRLSLSVLLVLCVASCEDAAPDPICALPNDCRLWEAAALADVRFGFHDESGPGDADSALAALEGNATTNHGVSWASFQPTPDAVTGSMDANCAFAADHDQFQIGFHFAWNQALLDDFPAWVGDITDPDELRAVLRERVRLIFERCPGLDRIDVLNEPLATLNGDVLYENHFHRVLGPDYIAELFEIVRAEAPPDVELFINENFIEYFPARAAAYVELVRGLLEAGAPVDAVGLQTHLLLVQPPLAMEPDWALLRRTMEELAALGVRVFVSELDVPVPPDTPDRRAVQAERYARVVEICLAVPACDTIVVWGIDDDHTWLSSFDLLSGPDPAPLLFDGSLRRKPAYFAVRDALLRGRGGDHPISGARFEITRAGDTSRISIASDDPGVVSPSPRSRNDPSQGAIDAASFELIGPHGRASVHDLSDSGAWNVDRGISRHVDSSGVLVLREGQRLDIQRTEETFHPADAVDGLGVRITLGSLRICLDFPAERIIEASPTRLVAEGASRPSGCDDLGGSAFGAR